MKKDIILIITILIIILTFKILAKTINLSLDIKSAFMYEYPNEIIEIYKNNNNIYSVIYKEKITML